MRSLARLSWATIPCLLLSLVTSCGKRLPTTQVDGKLLLDGQPLPNVLVTFVPEEAGEGTPVRSMGMTDAAGRFTLLAETQQPGALPGEHRVIVEDLSILDASRSADGTVISFPPQRFSQRYSDPLQTPLRATVQTTELPITLELTSKP